MEVYTSIKVSPLPVVNYTPGIFFFILSFFWNNRDKSKKNQSYVNFLENS